MQTDGVFGGPITQSLIPDPFFEGAFIEE